MKVITQTNRLTLSTFTEEDTSFIITLLNTPGWLRFIGDRHVRDEVAARGYLTNGPIASYETNGFGLYKVEQRESRTPIGMCGLLKRPYLEGADIGFAFLPEHTGAGYAHEAAAAVLNQARRDFNLPKVLAIVTPGNERSLRLLNKLGFLEKGKIDVHGEQLELLEHSFNDQNHQTFSAR